MSYWFDEIMCIFFENQEELHESHATFQGLKIMSLGKFKVFTKKGKSLIKKKKHF